MGVLLNKSKAEKMLQPASGAKHIYKKPVEVSANIITLSIKLVNFGANNKNVISFIVYLSMVGARRVGVLGLWGRVS